MAKGRRAFPATGTALTAILLATQAQAHQEAPPVTASEADPASTDAAADAPAASAGQQGIEDIFITAERRDTRLQDTPIAVNAFSGDFVEQARVHDFLDLATRVPGFSVSALSKSRSNPALRGGSSSLSAPGSDNAVAVFVDDVYYGSSAEFEMDFFDIERIEVLRGPQGTLFGRNSTGGSIAVVTRDPQAEPAGSLEVSVGNYNLLQARGFVTGSLSGDDSLLGSLSFTTTHQDGTSFNRYTDSRVDSNNRTAVRGRLRWNASDRVSLTVSGDYSIKRETNEARDFLGPTPSADSLEALGYVPDSDERVVDMFDNGRYESTAWGLSARLDADFDAGSLHSITAYRDLGIDQTPMDVLGLPVAFFGLTQPRDTQQFSQELRWVSSTAGRLDWVAGLYFLYQDDRRDQTFVRYNDPSTFGGALQAATFCPLQGDEMNFAVPECVAARPELFQPLTVNTYQRSEVYSYAAYAQGTYAITDTLDLTAGGRITHDRKTADGFTRGALDFIFNPNEIPGGFEGTPGGYRVSDLSASWTAFTPRFTVDWKPTPRLMFYGTVSRGFRSGAFQIEADPVTAIIPIEPEFVWNYELGAKTRFWNNRAQFNVALFQANYRNLQFSYTSPTGDLVVDNAGTARVRGVELELLVEPVENLLLSANYAYQDGEVRGFPAEASIPDGTTPGQTPKHTVNLGLSYDIELRGGGLITARGDFQYKSPYQLELNPDPAFTSRVRSLVNANLSYTTPDERWQFTLWGKNLTNEDIVIYGQDFRFMMYTFDEAFNPDSPSFNPAAAVANMPRYALPRTYGASVRFSF